MPPVTQEVNDSVTGAAYTVGAQGGCRLPVPVGLVLRFQGSVDPSAPTLGLDTEAELPKNFVSPAASRCRMENFCYNDQRGGAVKAGVDGFFHEISGVLMIKGFWGPSTIPFKDRLSFHLVRNTILVGLSIGVLFVFSQIVYDYLLQSEQLDRTAAQIFNTTENAAAHIVWNLDEIGGKEFSAGLLRHRDIVEVEILDDEGNIFQETVQDIEDSKPSVARWLFGGYKTYSHPLIQPYPYVFESHKTPVVGTLRLTLDSEGTGREFIKRAVFFLLAGLVRNVVLAFALLFVFHVSTVNSILAIGKHLETISPNDPGGHRILIPQRDRNNELGLLVGKTNDLLVAVGENIRSRQRAEAALMEALGEAEEARDRIDAILSSVADGLIVTDSDGDVLLMNRVAEQMFVITLKEARGRPFADLVPDSRLEGQIRALVSGGAVTVVDISLDRPKEQTLVVQAHSARVRRKDGGVAGVVTLLRDVSRERTLDRMKDEFMSTAAHELRTPLTSVLGYADLLINAQDYGLTDPAQQKEMLAIIHQKSQRLSDIVDDLLDLTRIKAGQPLKFLLTPCDIFALIREAVDTFRPPREGAAHVFELDLPPGGYELPADRGRIFQVLDNLLSNAVKFSPKGGTIRIGGFVDSDTLSFFIEDQGVGLRPDQIEKLFDRFYRVDTSTTAPEGLGLGLSIAKTIIEAHGGVIHVASVPGQGTRFTCRLPLNASG